ncbi:MAG: ATP-binding cassette domain-containing protein [Propionibacteriaceae bacterium]|nr:ATP-binding cassette domain-containing protein [Propionibacteriaceae bacterium]
MIVETRGLTKEYRRVVRSGLRRRTEPVRALDGLDLRIEEGSAVGYIGANGAGKSTTIKMLTGILVQTAGSVRTCGLNPVRQRKELARQVGVVFGQRSQLWWDLPLRESFEILAAIHRLGRRESAARLEELSQRLDLGETMAVPVRQLSLGQRMRAELAAALLHSPALVILDEPTIGLDVVSKQRLRDFLNAERADHGTTLLLATHDMGDVEKLCERVVVLDRGRQIFDGPLSELARLGGAERVLVVDVVGTAGELRELPGARLVGSEAGGMRQRFAFDPAETTAAALLAAIQERAEVRDLTIEEPGIEDVVRRLWRSRGTADQ